MGLLVKSEKIPAQTTVSSSGKKMKMEADVVMMQEISAGAATIGRWKKDMAEVGWDLEATVGEYQTRAWIQCVNV